MAQFKRISGKVVGLRGNSTTPCITFTGSGASAGGVYALASGAVYTTGTGSAGYLPISVDGTKFYIKLFTGTANV